MIIKKLSQALLLIGFFWSIVFAGNVAREFNIFAPPQTDFSARKSFVIVTAVVGNDYMTELDIIDRSDDGDSDDTYENIELTQGQSYIVFIREGDVNDGYVSGDITTTDKMDGDYFKIIANRRCQTAIGTVSDWEFDYAPPKFNSDGSVDFFVYIPNGDHADEWGLDVISYKNNTSVTIEDITNTPTTTSGYTSVVAVGSGTEKYSGTMQEGEDLLVRKDIDVFSGIDPRGRTFYVHADDSVAVLVGALREAQSAHDGASYVKRYDGLNVGKEFYFYIPLNEARNDEKEIKVNTYSQSATINLSCWNGSAWVSLASGESLTAYDHFDYIGDETIGYSQNYFKLTSSANVGVFTATWLETGNVGTSDMATYMSSEYGYGADHDYIVYMGPPGNEDYHGTWSHVYITSIDTNATVTIKDMATDGTIINEVYTLNAVAADTNNEFWDYKINETTWNQLNAGDYKSYLKIYSTKELRVFSSNWNDNWFAYAAGTTVPQYSAYAYSNFPYERWVLMGFPLELDDGTDPDDIFGPSFGGAEWATEPNINTNWRFSRWSIEHDTYVRWGETDYDGGYHGDPPDIELGIGYWFYQAYGSAINLSIDGSEVDTDDDFSISVGAPQGDHDGLNQFANPFPFIIDWKNTAVEVTTAESGTQEMTLAEANSAGILDQWSYRWNGYEYVPYNATNGGEFFVWDGFWVEQLTTVLENQTEEVQYRASIAGGGNDIEYKQCNDPLGLDGAVETDQFVMIVPNGGTGVEIRIDLNPGTQFHHTVSNVEEGDTFSLLDFIVKFVSKVNNIYTFTVSATEGNTNYSLKKIKFNFDQNISSPIHNTWVNIPRTTGSGGSGEDITSVKLILPPTDVDSYQEQEDQQVTYTTKYGGGDKNIKFEDCTDPLGTGGATESDLFTVGVNNGGGSTVKVKLELHGKPNDHEENLAEGGSFTYEHFTAEFVSVDNNNENYTFKVSCDGSQSNTLKFVEFKEFDKNVTSPSNHSGVTITRTSGSGKNKQGAGDKNLYPYSALQDKSDDWYVPMSVVNDGNTLRDTYNGFGIMKDAQNGYDKLDAKDFMPITVAFVDLYFPHYNEMNINDYWPNRPMCAAYDMRSDFPDTTYWNFVVQVWNSTSTHFTMSWDNSQIPSGSVVNLIDLEEDDPFPLDMKTNDTYDITSSSDMNYLHYFQIISHPKVTGLEGEQVPVKFALMNNYPNPFNSSTTINYSIDKYNQTELRIYTLQGQLVTTLVNKIHHPGSYSIQWDGKNTSGHKVASGLYFYRLSAGDRVDTKKIIFLK